MPKSFTVASLLRKPQSFHVANIPPTASRAAKVMKRIPLRTTSLLAAAVAVAGCQSAPKFAWWKQDKAAENTAVAATSKPPALPSAQSTPQAVAMAGSTPSTTSVAATSPLAGAVASTSTPSMPPNTAATPPALSIPVTSPFAVAGATSPYPTENSLADKLVSTPSSKASALSAQPSMPGATQGATSLASAYGTPPMVAAGPYDPSAYKPAVATNSAGPIGNTLDADRYATTRSSPPAPPVMTAPTNSTQSLASDPADRYGSQRASTTPTALPGQSPITDPASLATDRYANPSLPTLAGATPQPAAGSAAQGAPAVKVAAAGQYRPGGTSTYTSVGATTSPLEIASRPAPVSAPAAGTPGSQPWIPAATETVPPARPY
jgi:S-DNA-T family DNA segregation ATPase FtsK/SpoIIIE